MKHWIFGFLIVCSSVLCAESKEKTPLKEVHSFIVLPDIFISSLYASCEASLLNELKPLGRTIALVPQESYDAECFAGLDSAKPLKLSIDPWIKEDENVFKMEVTIMLKVLEKLDDAYTFIWFGREAVAFSPEKAILQENIIKTIKTLTKQLSAELGKDLTFYIL